MLDPCRREKICDGEPSKTFIATSIWREIHNPLNTVENPPSPILCPCLNSKERICEQRNRNRTCNDYLVAERARADLVEFLAWYGCIWFSPPTLQNF